MSAMDDSLAEAVAARLFGLLDTDAARVAVTEAQDRLCTTAIYTIQTPTAPEFQFTLTSRRVPQWQALTARSSGWPDERIDLEVAVTTHPGATVERITYGGATHGSGNGAILRPLVRAARRAAARQAAAIADGVAAAALRRFAGVDVPQSREAAGGKAGGGAAPAARG